MDVFFQCDYPQCNGKIFTLKFSIAYHMRSFHLEKTIQCDFCTMKFARTYLLNNHVNRLHKKEKYDDSKNLWECKICNKRLKTKKTLRSHMKATHEERNIPCKHPGCSKFFNNLTILKEHMKTHNKEIRWACSICKKTYDTKKGLTKHKKLHDANALKCQVCGLTFGSIKLMNNHLASKNVHLSRVYTCSACKQTFEWRYLLFRHSCPVRETLNQMQKEERVNQIEVEIEEEECELADYAKEDQRRIDALVIPDIVLSIFNKVGDEYECKKCKCIMPSELIAEAHQQAHEGLEWTNS